MKNLILLGAPGSGKGTQAAKLVKEKKYTHISTGNLLREEIAKKTELGNKVKSVMDAGNLVSDDLVVELLKSNLDFASSKFIFDGYPRNLEQAKTLSEILGSNPAVAIHFQLNTEQLVERLCNRRVSPDGKHIYNLLTNPPKKEGICDVTGEPLVHRDDDQEDVVRSRMEVFEDTIHPVLDYYKSKGMLESVNAEQGMEKVYEDLLGKIN